MISLVNQHRAAAGLPGLVRNPELTTAAQRHSEDQARAGRISHTGTDGRTLQQRIAATGYQAWTWGENVASGQATAADVTAAWMASDGHRANILYPDFTEIGMGLAYSASGVPYWTMDLAAAG